MNGEFIVFFDGVCNLCNGFIDFLLRADRGAASPSFKVASLQGATAAQKLPEPLRAEMNSIVVLHEGRTLTKSAAVLQIFGRLPWPWRLVAFLRVVPESAADRVYDFVAARRYGIFGKSASCRVAAPNEKEYFLE